MRCGPRLRADALLHTALTAVLRTLDGRAEAGIVRCRLSQASRGARDACCPCRACDTSLLAHWGRAIARLSSWRSKRAARRDCASSRNTFGMHNAKVGSELRPPPWRDKADTQTRSAPTLEKQSGSVLPLPSLLGDSVLQCRMVQTQRMGRCAGSRVRWWVLLSLLALLPRASAPAAPRGSYTAAASLVALLTGPSVVPGLLASLFNAARALQLFTFGALACWRSLSSVVVAVFHTGVFGSKPRTWLGPSRAGLSRAHQCQQVFLSACLLGMLSGARAQIDSRMYTRLACPTVKHRWLAASQYLSATTWSDGVQLGAQDAILVNSDTGTPAISKPFYDQSSKSVVFSPRSQSSTTGPYVNLQSVYFGTGDFTFVVLARYNAPGSSGDVWPRIFDFSTTGNQYGAYFILTEVRRRP